MSLLLSEFQFAYLWNNGFFLRFLSKDFIGRSVTSHLSFRFWTLDGDVVLHFKRSGPNAIRVLKLGFSFSQFLINMVYD